MPITPPPQLPNLVNANGQAPYTQQYNFGQAIGQVLSWNPSASAAMCQNWLNDALREWTDRRYWYGNLQRGQILTAGFYQQGSIALTYGSNTVQGTGTNWTNTLGGLPITQQSLRVGYSAPIYNIVALDQVNQVLTLELPWGNPSISSTGYFITSYYYSFPSVKFFYAIINLQLYYRLATNYPQSFVDNLDPSRLVVMYPRLAATMPPDPSGNYQIELWPASNVQQAFPFVAYTQSPQLVNDSDNFPAFTRTDALISYASSQALMYRPKANPYYSEATCVTLAAQKMKEFEMRFFSASQADEGLWRQDIQLSSEMQLPVIGPDGQYTAGGDTLSAMTPRTAWDYY